LVIQDISLAKLLGLLDELLAGEAGERVLELGRKLGDSLELRVERRLDLVGPIDILQVARQRLFLCVCR
jgi:hypothetical protein